MAEEETKTLSLTNLEDEGWSAEYRQTYERTTKELVSAKNVEEMRDVYDTWALQYDKDMKLLQWKGPEMAAECFGNLVTDKSVKILDVGAGSGLLAVKLRAMGFKNMDALDSSQEMLNVAKEQKLYSKYICSLFSADKTQGVDTDSYDAITCVGALGMTHIPYESILEMIRIVKPGGIIFLFYMDVEDTEKFPSFQDDLVKNGSMELVKREKIANAYSKLPFMVAVFRVKVHEPAK